ncbi:MAG: hypothetical protein O8C67_06110 [Candidatus Methanoperedens sp.]|nr:hypothetical protein [Candidatus Methanoperedens sp.]
MAGQASELHVYCPEHSEVMRSLGAIEAGQKSMGDDIKEIRNILSTQRKDIAQDRIDQTVLNTKAKILYGIILISFVAGISEGVRYVFRLFGH